MNLVELAAPTAPEALQRTPFPPAPNAIYAILWSIQFDFHFPATRIYRPVLGLWLMSLGQGAPRHRPEVHTLAGI